jgi:hypothetical protein
MMTKYEITAKIKPLVMRKNFFPENASVGASKSIVSWSRLSWERMENLIAI